MIKDSDGPIHILDAKKPMRLELRVRARVRVCVFACVSV